ncbi:hypothetical protein EIP86_011107 [Pleurotus ostreatoroseus]|nr:hypothetical protein EIP86_011107 [Pleurotus ostreatoroseus]
MSIAPRSPPSSPSRKRINHAIGSPLRIQIPQWTPPATIPEPTPALASGSESESEGTEDSPTTPRVVSPQKSATVVTISSPISPPTSDDVDSLPLGSLSLSDTKKSRARALSSSSPALGPIVFTKPLAKGSCGRPYVAWDRATGSVVCAKTFFKSSVRTSPHKELLRVMLAELRAYQRIAEADRCERSWLMEVHGVVQDMTRIFFVMDVMHADLFSVLEEAYIHSSHGIPEDISKRWIAQLALGIDSLHSMGIMHRDLKPENVLISLGPGLELEGSHLRITDFGHAWQAPGDSLDKQMLGLQKADLGQPLDWRRVYSNRWIGTLEYMAPEVHRREAYGPMVDWWTLGHLAYDIFTGQSLLPDERALHYFLKWQANPPDKRPYVEYRGPSWLSPEQVDLITRKKSGASIVHATDCDEPVAYIRAKLPEARGQSGDDAMRELLRPLSWLNPHGIWAHVAADMQHEATPAVSSASRRLTRARGGTL